MKIIIDELSFLLYQPEKFSKKLHEYLEINNNTINDLNINGVTVLMHALLSEQLPIADLLLIKGADINAVSKWGETPLILLAKEGDAEVIEWLVSHGAKVDMAIPSTGETALMKAAFGGNEAVVEKLLEHGADFYKRDLKGENALTWSFYGCAWGTSPTLIEFFIQKGADIELPLFLSLKKWSEYRFYGYQSHIYIMLRRSYRLLEPFPAFTCRASQERRAQHNQRVERKASVIGQQIAHETPLNQDTLQVVNEYVSLDKTFNGIVLHAFNGAVGYLKSHFAGPPELAPVASLRTFKKAPI